MTLTMTRRIMNNNGHNIDYNNDRNNDYDITHYDYNNDRNTDHHND